MSVEAAKKCADADDCKIAFAVDTLDPKDTTRTENKGVHDVYIL